MVIKRSNMNVSYAPKKKTTVSYYTYKTNSGLECTCVIERKKFSCHMTKMLYDSFSVSNTCDTVMCNEVTCKNCQQGGSTRRRIS